MNGATDGVRMMARDGSKARKMPGWAVMFAMPVPARRSSQRQVTMGKGESGELGTA